MESENENSEVYYRAITSKDPRFDGVFFVGVKSTGIYCRPICPVRAPKRASCLFFHRAVEAEREGFRACFRCRPELAPGHSSVDATSRLAQAAVKQINAGFLNEGDVGGLASRLGVTSRHLRRVLGQELGTTPTALAQSRRLAMAKQLLQETQLSMTELAFASGFSSVRRFNAAFQKRFQRTPSSLRKGTKAAAVEDAETVVLRLDYRPPLAWSASMARSKARQMDGIEWVDRNIYRRTAAWGDKQGWLQVKPVAAKASLEVTLSLSLLEGVIPIVARLRHEFDLDAHPAQIAAHLEANQWLRPRVEATPGLRLSGAFDPFAQMIRVILGQHISVKAATTICNRLIGVFGRAVDTPYPALRCLFPTPLQLASCPTQTLIDLGIPSARALALQTLSQAIEDGHVPLDTPPDAEQLAETLLALKGIGPWTVNYMMMRVLGEPDVFPGSDLEIRKALGGCSAREAEEIAEAWRPWRSYAAMYLWQPAPDNTTIRNDHDTL